MAAKRVVRGESRVNWNVEVLRCLPAGDLWVKIGHVHRNNGGTSWTGYPVTGRELGTWATRVQAVNAVVLWDQRVRVLP